MVIGISGKMGSGKDTTARMIQYILGKHDEEGHFPEFKEFMDKNERTLSSPAMWGGGFTIEKFAYKLKLIASILTGYPVEMFEDQEFKKTKLGPEWDYMTVREFLQKLGTDGLRSGLHQQVWVNALFAGYVFSIIRYEVPTRAAGFRDEHVYPKWIITDVRFPNEAIAVKNRRGIMIRINRPGLEESNHPSETALDSYSDFDHIIENNGSMEDLEQKVREILIKEGLL